MKKVLLFLFLGFMTTFTACQKEQGDTEITGFLEKLGGSTWQYGTHIITINDTTFYALNGKEVNLNQYLNKTVTITADKIKGYPDFGGPEYFEVKTIK